MPIDSWGKSGILAYFWLKNGYSGHIFGDRDLKFVLPIIYINIKGKTQLTVNWTHFDHFDHFDPQKNHKNGHISKRHFGEVSITKSLLLLHFFMNLSETFGINVNMNFANNLGSGILIYASKKF